VYIEELSADSVEGYAEARSRLEGERRRRRRELVAVLLRDPPSDQAELRSAADDAGWRPPRTAAALACSEEQLERLATRLPADALATPLDGIGCAIVSDPDGPGRRTELEEAIKRSRTRRAALGPTAPLSELGSSWPLTRAALRAIEANAIEASGLVRVDDVLGRLLLLENDGLVERIAARRLAPFASLTPKARRRMEETALAYVQRQGNAAAMARALGVHPQTARYRVARLRELLGDALDDADARFELELVLRAQVDSPD
jgi:hypothetical protein